MSPALLRLRPYQREALDALAQRWASGGLRYAVELPTGAGKTVCFAHGAVEHLAERPDGRVVVLVHTDELVAQAYQKLTDVAPHIQVGIVKAQRKDFYADVIVASVQTLRTAKNLAQLRGVTLIIVDEAHHVVANSYLTILRAFPDARVAGYSATLMRSDGKQLGTVWEDLAYQRDISWMVRKRYLVPPRGKAIEVPDLDLRNVRATKADYREGELGEALAQSLAPELVAKAWLEHAAGRRTLAFFPTVASAEVFALAFEFAGVGCKVVHGGMPLEERKRVLREHKAGKFPVLANCMILTEGYDDPKVSCIVVGRPTKSKALYIQIAGRGLRVDPEIPYEEQDCLLLDVVGASGYHSDLRSMVDLSVRPIKEDDAHSGRTLVDLEDEFDAGLGVEEDKPAFYVGETVTRDFDPLGRESTKVWLKTKDGTFFLPSGKSAYVFIVEYPEPGTWSVAWCGQRTSDRFTKDADGIPRPTPGGVGVAMTEHRGLPLEQAMVWAEDLAIDMGADLNASKKSAAWRKKPCSEPLRKFAVSLGIKLTEIRDPDSGMVVGCQERMGAVSDMVNRVKGSQRIDPLVRIVQKGMAK